MLPEVESALKAKGQTVPRPKYDGATTEELVEAEDESNAVKEEEEEVDQDDDRATAPKGKLDKFKMKPNHEATSDEDEA